MQEELYPLFEAVPDIARANDYMSDITITMVTAIS